MKQSLEDLFAGLQQYGKPHIFVQDDGNWYVKLDMYTNSTHATIEVTNNGAPKTKDLNTALQYVLNLAVETVHTFEFGKPAVPPYKQERPVPRMRFSSRPDDE